MWMQGSSDAPVLFSRGYSRTSRRFLNVLGGIHPHFLQYRHSAFLGMCHSRIRCASFARLFFSISPTRMIGSLLKTSRPLLAESWNCGIPGLRNCGTTDAMYIYCAIPATSGVKSHDSQPPTHIWVCNSGILEFWNSRILRLW